MNTLRSQGWFKALVLVIIGIGFMIPQYCQYQMSPLATQVMERFQLSATEYSSAFTASMVPAVFLSILIGTLSDKFGPKKIISILFILSFVGVIMRPLAGGYATFWIACALTGMVASGLNANAMKLAGSIAGQEKAGMVGGVFFALSNAAITIATATSAYFLSIDAAFYFGAVIMIIDGILFILLYKEQPLAASCDASALESPSFKESFNICMKTKEVWICAIGLFLQMGAYVGLTSFLPTALAEKGMDSIVSGWVASALTFGNIIGCLGIPILSSKIGKMKLVLFHLCHRLRTCMDA